MAETLAKKIILVGYGYLAKKTEQLLLQQYGFEPQQILRLSRQQLPQSRYLNCDLDRPMAAEIAASFKDATVIYLVPPPAQGQSDPRMQHFLQGLGLCLSGDTLPQKMVLISTTGVYGDCDGRWVDEQEPLKPQLDRARRRLDAEQQFLNFCRQQQIAWTILRVSGIYASDRLPLKRLKAQQPVVRIEESPYSNRIHADDLSQICAQALVEEHPGIYNCSDGSPSTMSEYFIQLAQHYQLPEPPQISLEQAREQLSVGMFSYMQESRRISNKKLLCEFDLQLQYPSLQAFLLS